MTYLAFIFLFGLVFGLVAVAANPAPYFAAFGLVLAGGVGCGILVEHGGPFLSLVLFLIYLGGMLVVFAYSAALAAEPFPETLGDYPIVGHIIVYLAGLGIVGGWVGLDWYEGSWVVMEGLKEFFIVRGDSSGVAMMYHSGGGMLIVCAWVLLLTLFVVLALTRGLSRGAIRAIN
uniref:NADH-ubiquinone oxidoreductase chain 6 n=1 Tax=Gymnorhamphichthys sp. NM-2010 TaxID=909828 RepID=F7UIC6_9TELE|nr:NADH dehydrogenase subunit 6 [Gymnorhamphichthys sp. NM-2010]